MSREPSRDAVVARLERLRQLHVPELDADARRRLSADAARARHPQPLAQAVGARLAELRALLELTRHLRGARASARAARRDGAP